MNINIKTHLMGIRTVLHYYLMGVAIGWAGFPIVCIVSVRLNWTVDKIQTFYSIFATLAYTIPAYLAMHDMGEHDRRPYKWARYKGKGLVCGAMGFLVIVIIEAILIFFADKNVVVQHPVLNIQGVHGYVTMILYMPFFWVYKLLNPAQVMPSVTYLTSLIPGIYVTLISGFGYWMGYTEKVIIKHKPKGKLSQKLFYGNRKKKKSWTERLLTKAEKKEKD